MLIDQKLKNRNSRKKFPIFLYHYTFIIIIILLVTQNCPENNFNCTNGQCVDNFDVCDGFNDCTDNSDEEIHMCKVRTFWNEMVVYHYK